MSAWISANLPYLLAGISVGGQYALIAIGYTMVYGILRLINFAHGDVFMVAGLIMVYATASLPIYISVILVVVATVLLGVVIEKVAYKPLRSAPRMSVMISAIGVSYLLQNCALYFTGGLPQVYPHIPFLSKVVQVGPATTKMVTIVTPILTLVLVCALVALIKYTKTVSYMEDGELAVVTRDGIQVYNNLRQPIEKEKSIVDWDISDAEKGGYEHFMFKEIMEQPEVLRKAAFPRIKNGRVELEALSLTDDFIRQLSRICIVACGSSYHVGMVGKYILEGLLRKPVDVALASEFRYASPIIDENSLVIVISQSGETLDTMAALREAKRLGAKTLGIVNVVGSTIAKESDDVLYTWAGPEIAVATTKAYSSQLIVLGLLGVYFTQVLGTMPDDEREELLRQIQLLPSKMEEMLSYTEDIQYFASQFFNHESIFFIGRNLDYAMGLEGSLKLKEISYIHSEAYAAGELKHGTISLIVPGTLVVALATYDPLFDKAVSNIVEVKSRGATVLGLTTEGRESQMGKVADAVITIPETHPLLLPSLSVVPLQLFAYYVALQRGCDIDKPRNLAKSVTVE